MSKAYNYFPKKDDLTKSQPFKQISVISNYYPIQVAPNMTFIQYHYKLIKKEDLQAYLKNPSSVDDFIPLDSKNLRDQIIRGFKR